MKTWWLVANLCLFAPVAQSAAQSKPVEGASPAVFFQESGSSAYRAVFAQFLAVIPSVDDESMSVDCAISISNVCASPASVAPYLARGDAPTSGRITLFLYNLDGTRTIYQTQPAASQEAQLGAGLSADGTLEPGHTWTVRLAEILASVYGVPEDMLTDPGVLGPGGFRGYGWILSDFDCLAGTYNNTVFGVGFTQAYEMVPAMGQGGFFGGVMIEP